MAASFACTQAIWMARLFEDLGMEISQFIKIHCDNTSTIAMTKNPMFHCRSKRIDIHHHFMRDLVEDGSIEFQYCKSKDQLANIFIKPLAIDRFLHLREKTSIQTIDIIGKNERL